MGDEKQIILKKIDDLISKRKAKMYEELLSMDNVDNEMLVSLFPKKDKYDYNIIES